MLRFKILKEFINVFKTILLHRNIEVGEEHGSPKAGVIWGWFHFSQRSLLRERCHQMMRPTRMRAMGGMIIRPLFS